MTIEDWLFIGTLAYGYLAVIAGLLILLFAPGPWFWPSGKE